MESISVHHFHRIEERQTVKATVEERRSTRSLAGLVLRFLAIVLWLGVGTCLAWLLDDFNRALAPDRSSLPSWLILAMFFGPSPVIAWLQWRAWRMSAS